MPGRVLLQLDPDKHASSFDAITAYDAGVDHILPYSGVAPADVPALVHGAIFTRGPARLQQTAIFIGGQDVSAGEELMAGCIETFFDRFRVSILLDPSGANTTAAALVASITAQVPVAGRKAVVLAAGAVGMRVAVLLARAGARVVVTSRQRVRAETAAARAGGRFGVQVTGIEVTDAAGVAQALQDARVAVTAGPPGVLLLPREIWVGHQTLAVVADVNAVPPLGAEGLRPDDYGTERAGKKCFGALGVGGLKMKVHRAAVAALYTANNLVLDADGIYALAKGLVSGG